MVKKSLLRDGDAGEFLVDEFEDQFFDFIILESLDDIHGETTGDELAGIRFGA